MITVVVLVKNEEKNIVDCLESLSFCDEILVIDDFSSDRTVEIAKEMNGLVSSHKLDNDFSKQRNYALSLAKNDWILFIDADERVSEILKKEIVYKVSENKYDGFLIKREDSMWRKKIKHGEVGDTWLLRLGKKNAGKWEGSVHEKWVISDKVGKLTNHIEHYPHQSIEEFVKEVNYYTDLRAKELYSLGVKVKWYSILLYPKAKFLLNYFLKLGFMDGLPGFILAIMMSFHSFLVRGKLWVLNQKD